MKTVHKYNALAEGSETPEKFTIKMPKGAEILTVQSQDSEPQLWARVDTDAPKEDRKFGWRATGDNADGLGRYVGTVQSSSSGRVFHLFELA